MDNKTISEQSLLLRLHLVRDAADEEVRVQVEAVGAARALALHVRLAVHAQHGVAAVARHHQLVPAAVLHLHRAGDRARPRACVEPGGEETNQSLTKQTKEISSFFEDYPSTLQKA